VNTPIPRGFRQLNDKAHAGEWPERGDLIGLCKCGHTELAHVGFQGQGHCLVCHCLQFTWVAHIVPVYPDPRFSN